MGVRGIRSRAGLLCSVAVTAMSDVFQERLQRAGARLRKAEAAVEKIEDRVAARHWTETDSATGSGIRRKPNAKADARRFALQDREAAAYAELADAESAFDLASSRLAFAVREAARVRLTREDLLGARAVRTRFGWHAVVRVNAKSVSVHTGYSWVDRVPFEDVLEVLL